MTDRTVTALVTPTPRKYNKRRITQALHDMLDRVCLETGASMEQEIALKVVTLAAGGDWEAIKFLTDRVEGKAVQAVELSGPDGKPIEQITATMSATEAARIYTQMMRDENGDVLPPEEPEDNDCGNLPQDNVVRLEDHRDAD